MNLSRNKATSMNFNKSFCGIRRIMKRAFLAGKRSNQVVFEIGAKALFAIMVLIAASTSQAGTHYVSSSGSHTPPFTSWETAATNIQDAVNAAEESDWVILTSGIYRVSAQITLSNNISLGSVMGPSDTVLDGQSNDIRGIYIAGENSSSAVSGLTIQNFRLTTGPGAGILMDNGTVDNCVIQLNGDPSYVSESSMGGGICIYRGRIINSAICGNWVRRGGGGIYIDNQNAEVVITNCNISYNYTQYNQGGGLNIFGTTNTVVKQCVIKGNGSGGWGGGGVSMTNGLVEGCNISYNYTFTPGAYIRGNGGGLSVDGGSIVRNCIISRNYAAGSRVFYYGTGHAPNGGGGIFIASGTVQNCTIAKNYLVDEDGFLSLGYGSGVYVFFGGLVENCIISGNKKNGSDGLELMVWSGGARVVNCCTPGYTNNNCITNTPLFAGYEADDFRILPGSPTIDKGTNSSWVQSGADFAGQPRVAYGSFANTVDIGAYEVQSPLGCSFTSDKYHNYGESNFVYTAHLSGAHQEAVWYGWDLNNDGSYKFAGADARIVTNATPFVNGLNVVLVVSNSAGEVAICTNVYSLVYVVPANPNATPPYSSWVTAATNLQEAISYAHPRGVVLLGDGCFGITNTIYVTNNVLIRSLNGPTFTSIGGNKQNITGLNLSDYFATPTLSGLSVSNCYGYTGDSKGGAVAMKNGNITNCILANNGYSYNTPIWGGGVYMDDGVISDCLIKNNSAYADGGICIINGDIQRCMIEGNYAAYYGALCGNGGTRYYNIKNCIIRNNSGHYGIHVTPIRIGGSCLMENCLIYNNYYGALLIDGKNGYGDYPTYISNAYPIIRNCTIIKNMIGRNDEALNGGYAVTVGIYTALLENCIIYFNRSFRNSGGFFIERSRGIGRVCPDERARHV